MQELHCPSCKEQFTSQNPPRLLTMCGHTFCHKCIRNFITKKKQKKYRIKCPLDKQFMEIDKPNPMLFPKNMVLLNLIAKNNLIPKLKQQENQFLGTEVVISYDHSESSIIFKQQKDHNTNNQTCKIHNKLLEVYCVSDFDRICTDCALFGCHKGHQIKHLNDLTQKIQQIQSKFRNIIDKKNNIQKKMADKQLSNQIIELFDNKKNMILKDINSAFVQLYQYLKQKQIQMKENLEKEIIISAQRLLKSMKLENDIALSYNEWEFQVKNNILSQSISNINPPKRCQKIKQVIQKNYYQSDLQKGAFILSKIQSKQSEVINNLEQQLHQMKLSANTHKIFNFIDKQLIVCGFQIPSQNSISKTQQKQRIKNYHFDRQDVETKLKETKDHEINQSVQRSSGNNINASYCKQDQQQSLLDFDDEFYHKQKNPLEQNVASCNNISVLSIKSAVNNKIISNKNNSVYKKKSTLVKKSQSQINFNDKKRAVSVNLSSIGSTFISRQNNLRKIDAKNESPNTKLKTSRTSKSYSKIQVDKKYLKLISQIKEDKLQTVDLSGAQLGNQKLIPILQAISQSKNVKMLKLMKNRLDDKFIQDSFKLCLGVQRINIAQNKLTQQSITKIIQIMKKEKSNIVYLNLGQNRIVQRKNRLINEEFKRLGVNIIL